MVDGGDRCRKKIINMKIILHIIIRRVDGEDERKVASTSLACLRRFFVLLYSSAY